MENQQELMINDIKQRMLKVQPLPDEPDFATCHETICRFLKAYEWKVQDAEKALLETIEYRRQGQPMRMRCRWCHDKAGYHSMRQVGNDQIGRPVVYANFAQASASKNSLEDIMSHVTYLIENAKVTMPPGVSTWAFVIDCTGMTLSVCSPKVGLKVVNLLSAHYPERLGLIICVNHNPIFHAFWKAIKKFLSPSTASKMRLLRTESKIRQAFSSFFPDDLATWMWDEITLNKTKPLISSQEHFWLAPTHSDEHDPRGCPSYMEKYVNTYTPSNLEYVLGEAKMHCPHPNIAVLPGTCVETINSENHQFQEDATSSVELSSASGLIELEGPVDELTFNDDYSEPDETDEDEVNPS